MKIERRIIDYEPVYGVVIKLTDKEAELIANVFEKHESITHAKCIRKAIENGTDN